MAVAKSVVFSLLLAIAWTAAPAAGQGGQAATATEDSGFLKSLFALDYDRAATPEMVKLIDAYLAGRKCDANSLAPVLKADAAYEPISPGWHQMSVQIADGATKYTVPITFGVPRSYRPDRPCRLLLAAHGQSSKGTVSARMMSWMLGADADKYIIVGPTMPGPRTYSGKAYQEQAYLRPLRAIRRRLNVDDDRIYIAGYSLGGHCTWHLATLFSRHFAAAVAMAGTPWFEGAPHTANLYLENLSNLPLWSIWGELDKPEPPAIGQVQFNRAATKRLKELGNTKYRATELPGVGHGGCFPDGRQFAAFLAAAKRDPTPEKFAHFFHLETHRRGYYLEATQLAAKPLRMDRPIRITFSRKPSDAEGELAAQRYFARFLFKMWGELDRSKNMLTIRTSRIRTVRVHVTEGMFDLAKPVTIRLNGRSWQGAVPQSPRCMLLHYAADRDAAALVYNEIDLPSVGRVLVRYK